MTFPAPGWRVLADIEASLTRSDPDLAAQFEHFNTRPPRRTAEQGRRPRRRTRSKKLIALLILPVVAMLLSWYAVTAAGGGSGGCATAVGTTTCAGDQSFRPPVGVHGGQETGWRASGVHAPRNAP